jgi:hypothetical protein
MSPTETAEKKTAPAASPAPAPKKRSEAENALEGHAEHIKTEKAAPVDKMRKDGRLAAFVGLALACGIMTIMLLKHGKTDAGYDLVQAYHARTWQFRITSVLGAVFLFGLIAPVPFYKVWMGYVATPMGWVMTRVILSLAFFVGFTPYAFVMWIFGRDPLRRKRQQGSYWITRTSRDPQHFKREF